MNDAVYGLQTPHQEYAYPSRLLHSNGGQGQVKELLTHLWRGFNLGVFSPNAVYDKALLPIELAEFVAGNKTYRFATPLVLHPKWNETHEYLVVKCDDYDLLLYAEDRKKLFKEIVDEFVMLWRVFVLGHDKLSPGAEALKRTLMHNLSVMDMPHGAE